MISSGDVTIKTNEPCSSKNWPHKQSNEQRRMNDLVEIVVGEVAGLQYCIGWKFEVLAVKNSLLCTFDQRSLSLYLFATSLLSIFRIKQFHQFTHCCQWNISSALNKFSLKARYVPVPQIKITVPYGVFFLILQIYWYEYFIILLCN